MSNLKIKYFFEEVLGENVWTKDEGLKEDCNAVFWDVTPYSKCFIGAQYIHHHDDFSSETSVYFFRTTRWHIPKDSQLHINYHGNLKSYLDQKNTTIKTAQFMHFASYHIDNAEGSLVVRLIWSNKNFLQRFSDKASINSISWIYVRIGG